MQRAHAGQIMTTNSTIEVYQSEMSNRDHENNRQHNNEDPNTSNLRQRPSAPVLESNTVVIEYTEVFVWGEDKHGQLGIDSQLQMNNNSDMVVAGVNIRPDFIPVPRSCSFNIVIEQVACGDRHSAILTA